jgi:N4-gp56 family major capsid protein
MSLDTSLIQTQLRPHFEKKLLTTAQHTLVFDQFARDGDLPRNIGSRTVRFFRREEADLSRPGAPIALTEGVAPTVSRDVTYQSVEVSLSQRGQVAKVTDVVNHVGLLNYMNSTIFLMGQECALDADSIIRDQLTAGLNKRYAGGFASFSALKAGTAASARITPQDVLDAATQLRVNKAVPIQGKAFVLVVPPQVERDIRNNPEWQNMVRYQYADKLFNNEIGDLHGVRLVSHTNPFVEGATEGTYTTNHSDADAVFSSYCLASEAYGVTKMTSLGGSPFKPSIIINDKPDSLNPLAQYMTVGWKSYWGSTVLNPKFGITLKSKTEFRAS